MKLKNYIFLLFICLVSSCNSKKNQKEVTNIPNTETNSSSLQRVWMLVEFNDFEKDYLIQKQAFLDLTNAERATAKMGCNNLSFPYKITNEKITFSNGIATKMFCEDMKLEDEFAKDLPNYTSYTIKGHQLTLSSLKGEKMVFVAQDWD